MRFSDDWAAAHGFPPDLLILDPEEVQSYALDWTKVYPPKACAVALPRSTAELARLLSWCHENEVAVVPSGGRTGLAGGAVAARGELVLSLERMRKMHPVDPFARTVRVEAGAVTDAVRAHTEAEGLFWPVEFAATGSSQIGGNISTNAGGLRVVRYGLTRQWVLGLTVVTMQGEILELNGALEKNNTGPDLRQLFIGTEGTLGVIAEATLKLTELPKASTVAFLAVPDLDTGLKVFRSAREAKGFTLLGFEYLSHACLQVVLRVSKMSAPLESESPAYLVVELEPPEPGQDEGGQAWLGELFEAGWVTDGVLADSTAQARQLWSYRERIGESLAHEGFLYKNDVSVPVSEMPVFVQEMQDTFTEHYPDFSVYLFGHVGDGNVHVNIMKPEGMDTQLFLDACHETDALLFDIVRAHKGSVSAEHGIGLLKRPYLQYSRSPAELQIFAQIKRALDPKKLLNPGKIYGDS